MNHISLPDKTSVVLIGHGSRDPDGIAEFERFVPHLSTALPDAHLEYGYLEFAKPTIEEAVAKVIGNGAREVVMLPALLTAATHAKNDMPVQLEQLKQQFPETNIRFASAMDLHPVLLQLCAERVIEAEATRSDSIGRDDTCLVVVGRGTSDPDANGDIAKMARMLQEGMKFAASFVCYSGTASPLVAPGLKAAAKLGHRRLIILPYFLFDGILLKRIYACADSLQSAHPELEVIKARHLAGDPRIADVFRERVGEAIAGRAHMNCSMCKYRSPIVGFEHEVGKRLPSPSDTSTAGGMYEPHPIERQSFEIIRASKDWSRYPVDQHGLLQRLVHTTGDFDCVDDIYVSPGAVETGVRALLRCRRIVTDVTMVQTGLKRALLRQLQIDTWCGVHDQETEALAKATGMTRSAAGIRRAWMRWGNDAVIAIGDAPTALMETTKLIREHGWRPQLVIGLPVGFVGTQESKQALRSCLHVPRITNSGFRGGSPWAAAAVNALLIEAVNRCANGANAQTV